MGTWGDYLQTYDRGYAFWILIPYGNYRKHYQRGVQFSWKTSVLVLSSTQKPDKKAAQKVKKGKVDSSRCLKGRLVPRLQPQHWIWRIQSLHELQQGLFRFRREFPLEVQSIPQPHHSREQSEEKIQHQPVHKIIQIDIWATLKQHFRDGGKWINQYPLKNYKDFSDWILLYCISVYQEEWIKNPQRKFWCWITYIWWKIIILDDFEKTLWITPF